MTIVEEMAQVIAAEYGGDADPAARAAAACVARRLREAHTAPRRDESFACTESCRTCALLAELEEQP